MLVYVFSLHFDLIEQSQCGVVSTEFHSLRITLCLVDFSSLGKYSTVLLRPILGPNRSINCNQSGFVLGLALVNLQPQFQVLSVVFILFCFFFCMVTDFSWWVSHAKVYRGGRFDRWFLLIQRRSMMVCCSIQHNYGYLCQGHVLRGCNKCKVYVWEED